MAKFRRIEVLNAITESGLVPVFFNKDIEVAKNVAKAVSAGGAKVLEFTTGASSRTRYLASWSNIAPKNCRNLSWEQVRLEIHIQPRFL